MRMTISMILFAVCDVLVLAAYFWFYEPRGFYGGYPANLWTEPMQEQAGEEEVIPVE